MISKALYFSPVNTIVKSALHCRQSALDCTLKGPDFYVTLQMYQIHIGFIEVRLGFSLSDKICKNRPWTIDNPSWIFQVCFDHEKNHHGFGEIPIRSSNFGYDIL